MDTDTKIVVRKLLNEYMEVEGNDEQAAKLINFFRCKDTPKKVQEDVISLLADVYYVKKHEPSKWQYLEEAVQEINYILENE